MPPASDPNRTFMPALRNVRFRRKPHMATAGEMSAYAPDSKKALCRRHFLHSRRWRTSSGLGAQVRQIKQVEKYSARARAWLAFANGVARPPPLGPPGPGGTGSGGKLARRRLIPGRRFGRKESRIGGDWSNDDVGI